MSYQTYITEAVVCGSFNSSDADRSLSLFTRELGMIQASVKSVREERSKHRFGLQLCSYSRVTLLRGKAGWKIIGSEPKTNLYTEMTSREARMFLRNTIVLLRRTIQGEGMHHEIFDDVIHACTHAHTYAHTTHEYVLTLRILHTLGYIAPHAAYSRFLHGSMPYALFPTVGTTECIAFKEAIDNALVLSQL